MENVTSLAFEVIESRLNRAVALFAKRDEQLVAQDASERAMTHWVAVYLQDEFAEWHVDVEYNRNQGDVKRVYAQVPPEVSTHSDEALTVFPDIIVHRRGSNENLLVVEAKKSAPRLPSFDDLKLRSYTDPDLGLAYAWGAAIVLTAVENQSAVSWYQGGKPKPAT